MMHLQVAFDRAALAGVTRAELLAAAGIVAERITSPETLVPLESSLRLWAEAARRSGDQDFGLHAGEHADPVRFGTLGYVIMSSATVRHALDAAIRYERLMYAGFTTSMRVEQERVVVRHAASQEGIPVERHPIEFALATILAVIRRTTGTDVRALEVRLQHAAPINTAEHERVFGVRATFGADEDALVLPASVLAHPVRGASPDVLRSLAPVVSRLHERAIGGSPTTEAVRAEIEGVLHRGEPTLLTVASALVTSSRSLQRKLADEGTSFQLVLDATRRTLTMDYLADRSLTLGEVAFLTGFRDGSAFHRAVRRWTDRTPGQLRDEARERDEEKIR